MKVCLSIFFVLIAFVGCKKEPQDLNKINGEKAPIFVDYENYEGGTSSLTDYRGKNVYIDLWATNCISCSPETVAMEKLKKQYDNKNIVFISLSIDHNRDMWREVVEKNEVEGVQLIANDGWNSSFVKELNVPSIPRAVLIDTAGYIIQADAPWPTESDRIQDLFDKL